MIVAKKEIELTFNMGVCKRVYDALGCTEFKDVPLALQTATSDLFKAVELGVLVIYHASPKGTWESLQALEAQVTDAKEVAAAIPPFLEFFMEFYNIRGEASEGEPVAPLTGNP